MHGTRTERRFTVEGLTRVEGEGSLRVVVRDGRVEQAILEIFEAPRYFEHLVVGRTPDEVIDIVARICGICPVAYQMSAVHAFEDLFGIVVDPETRRLRRLLYCGEWLESHALHIYLLHLPDFFGLPSVVELARTHRPIVEQGLALKRTGNRILEVLGGRSIHPVSVRVGGWSRAPRTRDLASLVPDLEAAVAAAQQTLELVLGLPVPDHRREASLVSLRHPDEYPMNHGRIVSDDGLNLEPGAWEAAFEEEQVPWSHAFHARRRDGRPFQVGPAARIVNAADQLHPLAAAALAGSGLREAIRTNPHWSIAARAIELIHAAAEALEIVSAPPRPQEPLVGWTPRPGIAAWSTEAPRGLLFHRYEVGDDGLIRSARIVPPTAQNQAIIESDLATAAEAILDLPHDVATARLEQLVRSYDPCISCATHFLDLRIEEARTPEARVRARPSEGPPDRGAGAGLGEGRQGRPARPGRRQRQDQPRDQ
jgi:sulfhydrogenase subunit alpha